MLRDPIRVGSSGKLRVQFLDSAQEPIEATSVTVDLFAPGLNPDVDTPTITGLVPVYLGEGVFELTFIGSGPAGIWVDRWTGSILGTPTIAKASFSIVGDGIATAYPIHGLQENTLVEVFLSSEISSLAGAPLANDFSLLFTTTYNPLYSSVRKVRLDAGGSLTAIDDDTINLAILEASLEADVLTFRKQIINNNVYLHARRQYVTCLAAYGLIENALANSSVKAKELADFKVTYDNNSANGLLDKLAKCIAKWEAQVQSGGGARAIRNPRGVVKGDLDPDRPPVGRGWYKVSPGETPIGNEKYRVPGSRRWRTGWISRYPRDPWGGSDW